MKEKLDALIGKRVTIAVNLGNGDSLQSGILVDVDLGFVELDCHPLSSGHVTRFYNQDRIVYIEAAIVATEPAAAP